MSVLFPNIMKKFDSDQRSLIEKADVAYGMFTEIFETAFGLRKTVSEEYFRHYFISSDPGLGKSHQALNIIKDLGDNAQVNVISGRNGMVNIMIPLAYALRKYPSGMITVVFDDADDIIFDTKNVDVLKGAFDPNRNVMEYNNNFVTSKIANLQKSDDPIQQEMAAAAIACRPEGTMGIKIPTERFKFIILSNKSFNVGPPKTVEALKAVASRLVCHDFRDYISTNKEKWGWAARIAIHNQILENHPLTEHQLAELLCYMYDRIDRIKTIDMRELQKFALEFFDYPDVYRDRWNFKVQHVR
jgi:hypothetical protein